MPPSRLIDNQETDELLGSESPSKEADYSCWGRKRKKKRKSVQEEQVSHKRAIQLYRVLAQLRFSMDQNVFFRFIFI